jgi:hypothetical protein
MHPIGQTFYAWEHWPLARGVFGSASVWTLNPEIIEWSFLCACFGPLWKFDSPLMKVGFLISKRK